MSGFMWPIRRLSSPDVLTPCYCRYAPDSISANVKKTSGNLMKLDDITTYRLPETLHASKMQCWTSGQSTHSDTTLSLALHKEDKGQALRGPIAWRHVGHSAGIPPVDMQCVRKCAYYCLQMFRLMSSKGPSYEMHLYEAHQSTPLLISCLCELPASFCLFHVFSMPMQSRPNTLIRQ